MPTSQTIKFNSILNIWEHWVADVAYQDGGYWSVGLMGNDQVHTPTIVLNNTAFNSANVIDSIEDISYTDFSVPILKSVIDLKYEAPISNPIPASSSSESISSLNVGPFTRNK